jgi:hypothetical protein
MHRRSAFQNKPSPRSATPLVVAIVGLVAAIASFAVSDENLSATLFGSGLITAAFCLFYWVVNPKEGAD